jgi:hypothetical protein
MSDNPNVGPEPVEAKPNHVREKTYTAPNPPKHMDDALQSLPEKTAEDKVREDMPKAVDQVRKRL